METFFQTGSSLNEIELEELLLFRYGSLDYILKKDVSDGLLFIDKAFEKVREDKIYRQWLAYLPWMNKKTYISFENFKDRLLGKNIDRRSTSEILREMNEIEDKFKNRR